MADCMRKCCDSTKCDVAYFMEKKCYQVSCSNKDACRPLSIKPSKTAPLMSAMMMKAEPVKDTGNTTYLLVKKMYFFTQILS